MDSNRYTLRGYRAAGITRCAALCAALLFSSALVASANNSTLTADTSAYLVENVVCTILIRSSADSLLNLTPTHPVSVLLTSPANCSGNAMSQNIVPGGVKQLIQNGFRLLNTSHQLTSVMSEKTGRAEFLVSGVISLERPTARIR